MKKKSNNKKKEPTKYTPYIPKGNSRHLRINQWLTQYFTQGKGQENKDYQTKKH